MGLRSQQEKLRILTDKIYHGAQVKEIFLPWAVGGGKSLAPVILSKLLTNGRKQIVIIPRNTLRQQGEAEYTNDIYPVSKTARIASNIGDPFRGCDACFVTYQGIAADPERWTSICRQYDCMLVLDECHHLSGHGDWLKPIEEMKRLSFMSVFLTGTPFRGDETKLPFFPYNPGGSLNMTDTETRRFIQYTNKDALRDGAVLPFEATLIDGSGSYIDLDGITRSFDTLGDTGDHLRCVFDSEYADHFLDLAIREWQEFKSENLWSKMLIVAKDIKTANKYTDYIAKKYPGIRSGIATSDDAKDCIEIVKRSKLPNSYHNAIECLISVGICYEGLNIPAVTHEVVMTVIRSMQWIQQCLGRCTRNHSGKARGFVYAPKDKRMVKLLELIDGGTIKNATADPEPRQQRDPNAEPETARTITALESKAHIEPKFGTFTPLPQETQSEIEYRLRSEINAIINKIVGKESAGNRKVKERIFWMRVKQIVSKGRDESGRLIKKSLAEMTVSELKKVAEYARNYK